MSDTTTYTEEDTYFTLEADGFGSSTFPVLNCGSADFASKSMTSYLRIGAVPGAEPGDELLDLLQHAGPPGDPVRDDFVHDTTNGQSFTTARTETEANASGNREVLFIDDVRDHSDDATVAGHHLSKHQRQLESAKLKTRGGWRERCFCSAWWRD